MHYPNHIVTQGEPAAAIVAAIATRLADLGYPAARPLTTYDPALMSIVKLFQTQHVDRLGRPLIVDGAVGPMTWGALFGSSETSAVPGGLGTGALAIAVTQIGVREQPPFSNKGQMVETYQEAAGAAPGDAWCMAFVTWCFQQASAQQGVACPWPRSAGCLDVWNTIQHADPHRIMLASDAIAHPERVRPGMVFVLDHGHGHGHTGFVRQSLGGALRTVEGNSNNDGSPEGVGVFDLNRRKVTEPDLLGFIDYTT